MSTIVGVGIDLVEVDRFAAALARRPALAQRLFTDRELADAAGKTERLAARFAAKEAVLKVMGSGIGAAPFRDIEVQRHASGKPSLVLHGRAEELAQRCSITSWQLSLTHTQSAAGAIAIGLS